MKVKCFIHIQCTKINVNYRVNVIVDPLISSFPCSPLILILPENKLFEPMSGRFQQLALSPQHHWALLYSMDKICFAKVEASLFAWHTLYHRRYIAIPYVLIETQPCGRCFETGGNDWLCFKTIWWRVQRVLWWFLLFCWINCSLLFSPVR